MLSLSKTWVVPAMLLFSLGASTLSLAQTTSTPVSPAPQTSHWEHQKEHYGQHPQKFWSHLNLTTEQKAQMDALMQERRVTMKNHKAQFQSILTPEQKTKLDFMRGQWRDNKQQQREQWLAQLKLTDTQKQQVESMKASHQQEREAFHHRMMSILTPQQKEQLEQMKQQHQQR